MKYKKKTVSRKREKLVVYFVYIYVCVCVCTKKWNGNCTAKSRSSGIVVNSTTKLKRNIYPTISILVSKEIIGNASRKFILRLPFLVCLASAPELPLPLSLPSTSSSASFFFSPSSGTAYQASLHRHTHRCSRLRASRGTAVEKERSLTASSEKQ